MYNQRTTAFGDMQRLLAQALYDAGKSDSEIGLEIGVSVNNIIDWRSREGLKSHSPAAVRDDLDIPFKPSPPVTPAPTARPAPAPVLITAQQAQQAYIAPVEPQGDNALEIGTHLDSKVSIDLEELLTTRLLVQGNSGSGKSHLLRKIIEESAGIVQQVIIDPEGDFAQLEEVFGHTVVQASDYPAEKLRGIAGRVRAHRGSVVLNLDGLDVEEQMNAVAEFLGGLFEAPREQWFPALVFVDEAHLFAPSADNGEDRDIRKACLAAVSDLMCRGRKRGLAGVIATQRLAKLHKNVAAEASNFLMGRTFLDIDISRAADLLGLPTRDAEQIRNLKRGEFLGLGPAIARRPFKITIGTVMTQGKTSEAQGLVPLPSLTPEQMREALLRHDEEDDVQPVLRVVK